MFPVPPMNRIFIAGHYILATGSLARGLRFEGDMRLRLIAVTLALSVGAAGCVTTTAHSLLLTGNPLRDQAIACEQSCQKLRAPVQAPCDQMTGHVGCTVPRAGSEQDYASCLDNCPGARATDGSSCPDPPESGVICVETSRANAGAIAGGVGATAGLVLIIVILSSPFLLLAILIAAH